MDLRRGWTCRVRDGQLQGPGRSPGAGTSGSGGCRFDSRSRCGQGAEPGGHRVWGAPCCLLTCEKLTCERQAGGAGLHHWGPQRAAQRGLKHPALLAGSPPRSPVPGAPLGGRSLLSPACSPSAAAVLEADPRGATAGGGRCEGKAGPSSRRPRPWPPAGLAVADCPPLEPLGGPQEPATWMTLSSRRTRLFLTQFPNENRAASSGCLPCRGRARWAEGCAAVPPAGSSHGLRPL